jgi:hypothetical protein
VTYALSTTLHTSFEDAVERTRKALADQGFGVLTEIDVKATLKAKLGEDIEDYLILGACNPALAHRAVNVDGPGLRSAATAGGRQRRRGEIAGRNRCPRPDRRRAVDRAAETRRWTGNLMAATPPLGRPL